MKLRAAESGMLLDEGDTEEMNYEALVTEIVKHVGTRENVTSAMNCMTRLRINVKMIRQSTRQL